MKTAYSYRRFSSPSQALGDSLRRQTEPSVAWCQRNGYQLDDSLRDEGRSAFRGSNAKGSRSALAGFLLKIEAGLIKPGSVLLLENLDRLSRQKIDDSLELAKKILKAGVDIVTLMPERRYNADSLNNLQERLELEFTFHRAHDESKIKSERLREKWAQRRKQMRESKKVVSKRVPFWISVEDGVFKLNEKVEWVRTAYQMAIDGYGYVTIVRRFNELGWKIRRATTVDRHLIRKLLRNRQTLGEHQPRTFNGKTALADRPVDGEVIEGYFPAAVSPDTFHRAQAALDVRKVTGRGRGSSNVNNLFKGLMYDLRDGSPIYQDANAGVRYLVNWNAAQGVRGACSLGIRYEWFERAMLGCCFREINPSMLVPVSDVDTDIAQAEAELKEIVLKTERAKERLSRARTAEIEEVVTEQLGALKEERKAVETHLDALKAKKTTAPAEQMGRLKSFIDALEEAEDKERLRLLIRALVGSLVKGIGIWIQGRGYRQRRAWVKVTFKTGLVRKLVVYKGGTGVTMIDPDDDPGEMVIPEDGGWK